MRDESLIRRCAITVGAALLSMGSLMGCAGTKVADVNANSSTEPGASCGIGGVVAHVRTELYFGKSIPGGGTVTDAAFEQFLNQEVTPRFPAGFTVVPARGQFRQSDGVIAREATDMLILFYPRDSAGEASKKIDEIRAAYDKTFRQESSPLREDEQPSCVAF